MPGRERVRCRRRRARARRRRRRPRDRPRAHRARRASAGPCSHSPTSCGRDLELAVRRQLADEHDDTGQRLLGGHRRSCGSIADAILGAVKPSSDPAVARDAPPRRCSSCWPRAAASSPTRARSTSATIGPLAGDAGKGSWRFGVASAATQIEDMNTEHRLVRVDRAGRRRAASARAPFVGDATDGYTMDLDGRRARAATSASTATGSRSSGRASSRSAAMIDEAAIAHYRAELTRCARWASARSSRSTTSRIRSGSTIRATSTAPSGPTDTNLCGLGGPGGAR